jgi:hypothetical protein
MRSAAGVSSMRVCRDSQRRTGTADVRSSREMQPAGESGDSRELVCLSQQPASESLDRHRVVHP